MDSKHLSDSSIQKEIELKILKDLGDKYEGSKSFTGLNVQLDFWNEEEKIIGEIYAGLDNLSPGSKRKVIADCFKLVTVEKLLGGNWDKQIIFIDEKIKKKFEGKSWIQDAIKLFNIKLMIAENISEEDKNKIRIAKDNQRKGNISNKT